MTPMRTCLLLQVCILDAFASSDFHPISVKDSQRHLSESERASVAFWHINENRLVDKVYDNDEERGQGQLAGEVVPLSNSVGTVATNLKGKLAGEMLHNVNQVDDELTWVQANMVRVFSHSFRKGMEYESIISLDLTRIEKDLAKSTVTSLELKKYTRLLDFHVYLTDAENAPLSLWSAYQEAKAHFTPSQQLTASALIAETEEILKLSDSFAKLFEKKISPMIIAAALPLDSIKSMYKSPALRRGNEKKAISKGRGSNDEVPGTFLDYITAYKYVIVELRTKVRDKLSEIVENAQSNAKKNK